MNPENRSQRLRPATGRGRSSPAECGRGPGRPRARRLPVLARGPGTARRGAGRPGCLPTGPRGGGPSTPALGRTAARQLSWEPVQEWRLQPGPSPATCGLAVVAEQSEDKPPLSFQQPGPHPGLPGGFSGQPGLYPPGGLSPQPGLGVSFLRPGLFSPPPPSPTCCPLMEALGSSLGSPRVPGCPRPHLPGHSPGAARSGPSPRSLPLALLTQEMAAPPPWFLSQKPGGPLDKSLTQIPAHPQGDAFPPPGPLWSAHCSPVPSTAPRPLPWPGQPPAPAWTAPPSPH